MMILLSATGVADGNMSFKSPPSKAVFFIVINAIPIMGDRVLPVNNRSLSLWKQKLSEMTTSAIVYAGVGNRVLESPNFLR